MALPPSQLITQRVLLVAPSMAAKLGALDALLAPAGEAAWASMDDGGLAGLEAPTISFVNSLARASAVQAHLAAAGASVALLHRDLTQVNAWLRTWMGVRGV